LAVSFSLHSRVMAEMLGDTGFVPYAIAASLEGFKLGTIVVYGYLHRKTLTRPEAGWLERIKPLLYVGLIRFFQLMVLSLSLLCTMAVIAKIFDRTNMSATQAEDMGVLNGNYQRKLGEMANRQTQEKSDLEKNLAEERQRQEEQFRPGIAAAEDGLRLERGRPDRVTGRVMGPRYEAHRWELETHTNNLQAALAEHNRQVAAQRNTLSQRHSEEIKNLNAWYEQEQEKIRHASYQGDHRVEHKTIAAVVTIINDIADFFGIGKVLAPSGFVAIFALMLSTILEMGIFLSFSALAKLAFPEDVLLFEQYMQEAQKKTSPTGS